MPEGSVKGFIRGGRVIIVHDNGPHLKKWRQAISDEAMHLFPSRHKGPVAMRYQFIMPRPKALTRWEAVHHAVRPDLDKLIRAVNDALTGIAYVDDGQIYRMEAEKHYAGIGQETGVWVTVEMLDARPHPDFIQPSLQDWIADGGVGRDLVGAHE